MPETPGNVEWVEATENPFGVRLLDVRAVTQGCLAASGDRECAANAVSFGGEDGLCFSGEAPPVDRLVPAKLRFPTDGYFADGVLFSPTAMEEKWALFHHGGEILFVRSWQRRVHAVATVVPIDGGIEITAVRGAFTEDTEAPEFTCRIADYLIRSHALGEIYPAPIPTELADTTDVAATWCMSMFGCLAFFATPETLQRVVPDRPLRTHSLLHIAVARGDLDEVRAFVDAGVPVDLLAGDGLAPLHWAGASRDPSMAAHVLGLGSPVDVRSDEGATPLMNAVQSGADDEVRFFLDHGADVNAQDLRGFTALHRASEMGHVATVRALLERGAIPDVEAQGKTARGLAESRDLGEIVALLDLALGR